MKYTYKKPKKFQFVSLLSVGWLVLLFIGCDSNNNTVESQMGDSINTINYELYDGEFIELIVDPNYIHKSLEFERMEDYDQYSIDLETSGSVTLNSTLWDELSHAYDPIEISIFDMNRSVIVENVKYTAGYEALYRLDLSAENAKSELEVYYGKSGEEDLIEIEKVFIARINAEDLSDYHFKNPDANELYNELNLGAAQRESRSVTMQYNFYGGSDCSSSCDSFTFIYPNQNDPYKFRYRSSPTSPVKEAHIGHVLWNQSHRSGIRKRSRGGTITIIDRLTGSGYHAMGDHSLPIGFFHENGSLDTSIPETYVRVAGRNSDGSYKDIKYSLSNTWTARQGSVKRGGGGTDSWHRAKVRMNDSNTSVTIFDPEKFVP